MELSRTTIFYLLLLFNCTLSAFLVVSFDGFLLYIKGVRLFNEKFEDLEGRYEVFSFHTFEVFRVIIMIVLIAVSLIYFKGGF